MFMFRKNRELRAKFTRYLDTGRETLTVFCAGIDHYLEHELEGLEEFVRRSHEKESACDAIRHELEIDLYEKSLLPESREDLLMLLERLDLIFNEAEDIIRQMLIQRVVLPEFLRRPYRELVHTGCAACEETLVRAGHLFDGAGHPKDYSAEVDRLESEADKLEHELIRKLFAGGLPLAEKLHYRDVILATGRLGDLAEDVANLMTVFRIKRAL